MSAFDWRAPRASWMMLCACALSAGARADTAGAPRFEAGPASSFSDNILRSPDPLIAGEYVLGLDGPLDPARAAALRIAGATPLDFLPPNGWITRIDGPVDFSALPFVIGVWPYPADARISADLRTRIDNETPKTPLLIDVTLFEQCDADAAGDACAAIAGGALRAEWIGGNLTLTFATTLDGAAALAALEHVQFVEPAPQPDIRNNDARWTVQSTIPNRTPFYEHGLTGDGEVIGIIDHHIDLRHCSFADEEGVGVSHRKLAGYFTAPGSLRHGTHVAGIAAGDGGAFDTRRGVAYNARLAYSPIPGFGEQGVLATFARHADVGARIHNNSWGDDTTGAYNTLPRAIDSYAWEHEDELIVLAVTNSEVTRNPENAKNAIAVGAADHYPNEDAFCRGGSGPTLDGRRKPDVMASGCSVMSAAFSTTCGARELDGTSMAAPAVSGAAALIREYYRAGYYPTGRPNPNHAFTPTGALLKATLINSAQDMLDVFAYPNPQEGWGRVVADEAVYFPGDARTMLCDDVRNADGLNTGETFTRDVIVEASDEPLRVTLVWTEPPATAGAAIAAINDLNLVVNSPDGSAYNGNLLAAGVSIEGATTDGLNNVEQVIVPSPPIGAWRIRVVATGVNVGPQGFALVTTGALEIPTPAIDAEFISKLPTAAPAHQEVPITVELFENSAAPGPAGPLLWWRAHPAQPFSPTPMRLFAGRWTGALPAADCDAAPQWYLAIETDDETTLTWPTDAPDSVFQYEIGETVDLFTDDMETDRGWIAGGALDTATAGAWVRATPVTSASKPTSDHSPAGVACWMTGSGIPGGFAGDYDVDGGATTLMSPLIDLSTARRAMISYWRWYSNNAGGGAADDTFLVQISNDDGRNWIAVETVGPEGYETDPGWYYHEFAAESVTSLTTEMRVRFIASDTAADSIVDAAIDDFRVRAFACDEAICRGDITADGVIDIEDLAAMLAGYARCAPDPLFSPAGDFDGDGCYTSADLAGMLARWSLSCP